MKLKFALDCAKCEVQIITDIEIFDDAIDIKGYLEEEK